MLYHVQFVADPAEPMPPLAELASVEADSPIEAVEKLVASGRGVPQNRPVCWARVVVELHENGTAKYAIRVPITPDRIIPVDWNAPTRG